MGDMRRPIFYSGSRRPRSSVVDGGESSFSRKRGRSPAPLPRRTSPLRYYSDEDHDDDFIPLLRRASPLRSWMTYSDDDDDDDDLIINDGSHRWDNDDREEDGGFSGGSDADDVAEEAGGGVEEQPAADTTEISPVLILPVEEDGDDDDRPMSVVSRARTLVHRRSTSIAPASMPAEAPAPPEPSPSPLSSSSPSSDSSSVIRNVTVDNLSAFDCSICYLPLKSPIFQCTAGHVLCSPCHDKLGQATSCHVCRVPIPDGYSRCNAMEQVVDSIRVPCPHAAHGCAVKPAYHERDEHAQTCPHKPCHCPAEGCGFAGPLQTTLLKHFATVHSWPCSVRSTGDSGADVYLLMGFNVVTVMDEEEKYTLVLKVKQAAPVCNEITAFCIHPSHTGIVTLGLSYYRRWRRGSSGLFISKYLQSSQLDVVCTDLSNGIPGPSSCYPFLVSRWSATPGGEEGDDISVTVDYIRRNIVFL